MKIIKIVLLGDSIVGKTSLINAYINGGFTDNTCSTFCSSFLNKKYKIGKLNMKLNYVIHQA